MSVPQVTEGRLDFSVPSAGKPCQTWYKIFGDLKSGVRPLVILHGGPGVPHNYLLNCSDLASAPYNIPVIMYDQLGCGNSTHLPEKRDDGGFWTVQLFVDELVNLVTQLGIKDDYDVLGHSWGGMLGAEFGTRQPKGLHKLILSCSPASMKLWVDTSTRLRADLPQNIQDTLTRCEKDGTTDSKEYKDAETVYYERHLCRVIPFPENLTTAFALMEEDNTVSMTMNGPSEFFVTGTLKDWDISSEVHKIKVPTLLINGHYDEAQDETVEPYYKNIPNVKWEKFANSSHMPLVEEREKYMKVVDGFLKS